MVWGSTLALPLGPPTDLVVTSCRIQPSVCRTSQASRGMASVLWNEGGHFKTTTVSFPVCPRGTPIGLFHLSNLLQMLSNRRMVAVEFLDSSSRGSNRISFSDALSCPCPLPAAAPSLLFKVLVSFANLPRCTLVCRSCVKRVDVVSCLHCFYNPF